MLSSLLISQCFIEVSGYVLTITHSVHPLKFFLFTIQNWEPSWLWRCPQLGQGLNTEVGELPNTPVFSYGLFCWTKLVVLIFYPIQQHKKGMYQNQLQGFPIRWSLQSARQGFGDRQGFVTNSSVIPCRNLEKICIIIFCLPHPWGSLCCATDEGDVTLEPDKELHIPCLFRFKIFLSSFLNTND